MHKDIILLGWASSRDFQSRNFGDELSPYIVEKLSGKKVQHVPFLPKKRIPFFILKNVLKGKINLNEIIKLIKFFFSGNYILAVGSILQAYKGKGAIVWGSGIVSQTSVVEKFNFKAVRGKYTRNRLLELGYSVPECYGDPALLLPLLYKPKDDKSGKIGIIPHVVHYDKILEYNLSDDFKIIDLRTDAVEKVVDEICTCEYIISSSLHGLIVSHAYGIKALWFTDTQKSLMGDGVKFKDYFSSVGIEEYNPSEFHHTLNKKSILELFYRKENLILPNVDLNFLQSRLLKAAPFKISHF